MTNAQLVSLNVGTPADVAWEGATVRTAIWKAPVEGRRMVRTINIDGDDQADRNGHGGEHRAVYVYQLDSYRFWQDFLGRDDFVLGEFGENLTVDGLPDAEVCIGDRYRVGDAVLEVTQPRVTCFRLGIRLREPRMPSLLVAHRRPGFYVRVITEGEIGAGDIVTKILDGPGSVTVAEASSLLYLPGRDPDRLRVAAMIPALSEGWKQSFRELIGSADAPASLRPSWSGFRALRVDRVVTETPAVRSIYLSSADGSPLPIARAGQYLTLRVPAADPAPVRSYSLSSVPDGHGYRISVKRDGLVSGWLHEHLDAGAVLDAAAPCGEFVLDEGDEPVLLVSAGIGVTPVLAMLQRLAEANSTRRVWWVHTTRNPAEHAFLAAVQELIDTMPNASAQIFYTKPGDRPVAPTITTGRLTARAFAALGLPTDTTAYVCGPERFMADVADWLSAAGLPRNQVHSELFGARSAYNLDVVAKTRRPPHQPDGVPGSGPQITFARSGLTAAWADGQHSLLDFADACDVPTRWSCRNGVCHSCVTNVLAGEFEYATEPLEPPGPDEALICCAVPRSDLVLDL